MTRKSIWLLFCSALLVFIGCQKAPQLTITSPPTVDMSVDGSRGTITFTANRDWTISTSDSWITVSPKAGEASKDPVSVTVSCSANTTYDDRTATVTIRMDELMQTVTIRQPANLGIILPTKSYNLESGANTFNVEVQANVPYSVSSSVDWIRQTGTKALTSTTYTFRVEENATYDDREGTVTIKSQNSSVADQVITVKQAQKDALIVQNKIFNMPYGGGEIEFKVEANVDFEVTPGEDWIHHVETKALSSSTVRLTVDENPTYSKREGKIEIKQKNGSLSHTITVKQAERIAVTSVTLDKTSLKLKEGETATLVATVKPDNATDKAVTWSSSNSEIATVDEAGNVFAQKEGSAKITAQAGEKTATCEVTVYKEIPVSSIELDKTTLSLAAGDAVTLKATVKPDDATDKTITWSSNDTNIAKVDTDGTVSAIGKGSTIITAYSGNVSASCKVFVKAASYPTPSGAVDLGLSVVWADKNLGASSSYDAGGYYLWGDPTGNGTIMFFDTPSTNYISDTQYDIARAKLGKGWRLPTRDEIKELLSSCTFETVSNGVRLTGPSGKSIVLPLTGMAFPSDGPAGTTSLMSKDKGFMMTGEAVLEGGGRFAFVYNYSQNSSYNLTSYNASMAKFPVRPVYELLVDYVPLSSILLNKNELVLMEGESETLTATVKPDNATNKAVNWYSSDVSVVFVDVNGIVTAMGEGTATVKAKQGAVASAPCSVTVKKKEVAVTEISLNKTNLDLKIGDSETLMATIKPEDATETVTWFSSDASVAAIDENGKVTAINTGTAAIIARVGEYTAACAVTVHEATIKVTSISLNKSSLTLSEGASETLVATIYPSNATEKVYWGTTSPAIATVDSDGKVTGIKSGSATISVIAGEKMASCEVTVVPGVQVPEAIDMGLSVKWASFNLGASKPEDNGDYFAWGEIVNKSEYSWNNYKWCNRTSSSITKYNTNRSYGVVDNKTQLDPEDDVVRVSLGGKWRMPTAEEWKELIDSCDREYTIINETVGELLTSRITGNTIFLPATYVNHRAGGYWSSSLSTTPSCALGLSFGDLSHSVAHLERSGGLTVRPVSK